MEAYITSVKDLVLEALSNFPAIKASSGKSNVQASFKMGMIYLLGINTQADYKNAAKHFSQHELADNKESNCILGFIAECMGDFSLAFQQYAKANSDEKSSYLNKVTKGRNYLQDYLKRLGLPVFQNKELDNILVDYAKGNASKIGASIKLATICNDEMTCLEAAQCYFFAKDYISAVKWLQKGHVAFDNSMYSAINKKFEESRKSLLNADEITVIDLEGCSLLDSEDATPFLNKVKKSCEEASMKASVEWKDKVKNLINVIVKEQKEKERLEQLEFEAKEAARKRKRNLIIKHSVACLVLFIIGTTNDQADNWFVGGISMIIGAYFWFYLIRWIWKKMKK